MKFASVLFMLGLALNASATTTPALKKRDVTGILDDLSAVDQAVQILFADELTYSGGSTDNLQSDVGSLISSISAAIAEVTGTPGPFNLDDSISIANAIEPMITDTGDAISQIDAISTLLPVASVTVVISDLSELYSAASTLAGVLSASANPTVSALASSLSTSVLDAIATGLTYYGQPIP